MWLASCMCVNTIVLYRHTEQMIKKVESAGLGFYTKSTQTKQRLGMNSIGITTKLVLS